MMASQSVLASLAADQTRYIFRGDKDALTITVTNNDKERTFGGQAWVDNIVEKDTRPTFVVTPSFFKVKPQGSRRCVSSWPLTTCRRIKSQCTG